MRAGDGPCQPQRRQSSAGDLGADPKGAGVSFMADHDGWHGKPMDEAHATRALAELGADDPSVIGKIAKPSGTPRRAPHLERGLTDVAALSFPADKTIATRRRLAKR